MKTPISALIAGAALGLGGCSLTQKDLNSQVDAAGLAGLVRQIEIEVDDPSRGLPCRVIDRPGAGATDVLWRAEFEQGFCERKARETLFVLRTRGWACRPLSLDDRRASSPRVAAIWQCLEGLEPVEQPTIARPRVPAPRPGPQGTLPPPADEDLLDKAVERDLAAIGQDIVGDSSAFMTALGDLNDDGLEDAVVLLTRGADREIPQRMLMAYLRNDQDYSLVDVWILRPPSEQQGDQLTIAIENGTVQLGACCDDQEGPTALVLNDRKLVYAEDG
ncbi:MAG: hypothetical protein AAF543_10825 [Pseudomonadota bacterium]